jgi:hypothetical protein
MRTKTRTQTLAAAAAALAGALLAARPAGAAVCAEIDATKDNLSPQDRAAALTLLVQALKDEGQVVGTEGCTATYRVYHVRLGQSVNVVMQGPQGTREGSAPALEQVPPLYGQMIRSLLINQPMAGGQPRGAVMPHPGWVESESIWYARAGVGGTAGPVRAVGPMIGFGYRYLLKGFGIDVSAVNLMFPANQGDAEHSASVGITGSWLKIMGLYVASPTIYLGAGASWGGVGVASNTEAFDGHGVQAEASAGFLALRSGTLRLFVQADASLPLFTIARDFPVGGATAYIPTFCVSLGLGRGLMLAHVL